MKRRWKTEGQILARIEQARHRRDTQQVEAWRLHQEAVKFWQLADSEQNEEHRRHGNDLERMSKLAAKSVSYYNTSVLPKLGEKLSQFRTELLRFQEKELRPQDHSIPVA